MALRNIFLAYDGSVHAKKALEMAKDIAELNEEIHVDIVNVVPIPVLSGIDTSHLTEIIELMEDEAAKTLHEAQDLMEDVSEQISTYLLKGATPSTELLKMVDSRPYDLVIVGSRGLSGIREYMGSVSYRILHQSKVPVLVIEA